MSTLNIAVFHAISFLTRPLLSFYSPATISKLHIALEDNLTALFSPSWDLQQPLRGSGRRCLALSPDCLPPRAIYTACIAAGVQWFDWIDVLGGKEFYLFVDPGCIAVRFGRKGDANCQLITIWADEIPSPVVSRPTRAIGEERKCQGAARAVAQKKTLAQRLLEEDSEDDDVLFTMIADEVAAPTWTTPITAHFTIDNRSLSPFSAMHSRSSSRSSSSSGGSFTTADSSETDFSFVCTPSSERRPIFRREKARAARVFIDTPPQLYNGGTTVVLTGGVMLGGAPKTQRAGSSNDAWRS